MVGNDFTGPDGAIRGVDAGGLPWVVDDAEVKLDGDGKLKVEVEVEGLVIADDESVPADLRETNPVPEFRAILSCLTPDGSVHQTENIRTATFPASEDGNAEIEDTLDLPRCVLGSHRLRGWAGGDTGAGCLVRGDLGLRTGSGPDVSTPRLPSGPTVGVSRE